MVFDHGGNVVASAQREFRQIFPKPGWVEHDAKEIWATQLHTASEAIGKARLTAADIAAIGITNQRETTVVWDRDTGEPIHHAIVWQDRRTAAACDRLKARKLEPMIKRKTGLVVDDQQEERFDQACTEPDMMKNTYGTGCFMLMNTGTKPIASQNNLLTTVAWRIGKRTEYALEGSIFIAGAVVQWLRDGLGIIKSSAEVEALAAQVTDTGGVYLVPAFAGLGAPHWDQYARGVIAGITRGTKAAHIARAALEGIAYQVMDVLHAMEADAGLRLKELRVDGGACADNLLMQFQSDLLGVPVVRPKVSETTALGAAYLAGLAVGFWKDEKEIARQWQADRRFVPAMKPATRKQLCAGWTKALARAKEWELPE